MNTKAVANLTNIPREMVSQIMSFLDYYGFYNLASLSNEFKNISQFLENKMYRNWVRKTSRDLFYDIAVALNPSFEEADLPLSFYEEVVKCYQRWESRQFFDLEFPPPSYNPELLHIQQYTCIENIRAMKIYGRNISIMNRIYDPYFNNCLCPMMPSCRRRSGDLMIHFTLNDESIRLGKNYYVSSQNHTILPHPGYLPYIAFVPQIHSKDGNAESDKIPAVSIRVREAKHYKEVHINPPSYDSPMLHDDKLASRIEYTGTGKAYRVNRERDFFISAGAEKVMRLRSLSTGTYDLTQWLVGNDKEFIHTKTISVPESGHLYTYNGILALFVGFDEHVNIYFDGKLTSKQWPFSDDKITVFYVFSNVLYIGTSTGFIFGFVIGLNIHDISFRCPDLKKSIQGQPIKFIQIMECGMLCLPKIFVVTGSRRPYKDGIMDRFYGLSFVERGDKSIASVVDPSLMDEFDSDFEFDFDCDCD